MESVLVTGGAGYIGSTLVHHLLNKKFKVTVLDNFKFGQSPFMHLMSNPNLEIHNQDINNSENLIKFIKKNDVIIPLAAIVGAPACNLNKKLTKVTNIDQAKIIAKYISKNQKIIFPVTNSGYGIGQKDKYCDEKSPLKPISFYGKSKVEAEKIIMENSNAISLRLATVFGSSPRMRLDLLVNDFVYRAYKDRSIVLFEGHFKRNFIHVQDVSSAFLFSIKNYDKMKNEIFNLGLSNANLSKKELCYRIKDYVKDLTIIESNLNNDPDKRDYIVSNKKIENTGWRTKFTLDMGIRELLRLYNWLSINNFTNI